MNVLKIELKNIGSFEHAVVFLGSDPRIVMVRGINSETGSTKESNGSGKSTMFVDAPEWCLWGRMKGSWSKDILNDEVLRIVDGEERAKEGYVEIEFELNSVVYKVNRSIKLGGSQSLKFFQSLGEGKDWQPLTRSADIDKLTGKRSSATGTTQQKIEQVLGCNADLFINSVCFEQGNLGAFAKASVKEREELLSVAVDVEKWQNYAAKCKSRLSSVEQTMSNINYTIANNSEEAALETLEEKKKQKQNLEVQNSKHREQIASNKKRLQELDKHFAALSHVRSKSNEIVHKRVRTSTALAEKKSSLNRALDDLKYFRESIEKCYIDLDELQYKLGLVFSKALELEDLTLKADSSNLAEVQKNISSIELKIANTKSEVRMLQREHESNEVVLCPGTKLKCKNVDNAAIEAMQSNLLKKISKLEDSIKVDQDLYNKRSREFVQLKEEHIANRLHQTNLQKLRDEQSVLENNILKLQYALEDNKSKVKQNILKKKELEAVVQELQEELNRIEAEAEAQLQAIEQLKSVEQERALVSGEVSALESVIESSIKETTMLEKKIEELNIELQNFQKLKKLDEEVNILEFAHKMYSKAIPHALIEQAIPEIEHYAKQFIEKLSKGRMDIDFVTNKQLRSKDADKQFKTKDTQEIVLTMDGKKYNYALFSGGEKSRADVALHLAYSLYLLHRSGAKLETLFLDEVTGMLDEEGCELLVEILRELVSQGYFKKVFLISHDDAVKKMFDDVITIQKTEEGSRVA